jgi:hypothetical protein
VVKGKQRKQNRSERIGIMSENFGSQKPRVLEPSSFCKRAEEKNVKIYFGQATTATTFLNVL